MNKESVISQAKAEYTKELISIMTEPMYTKFHMMFENCVQNTKKQRELLINFQKKLKEVPVWNQAQIDYEVDKITKECDWLKDLIAAIFISNVKILTSVKIGSEKKKIQVTMPKTDQFVHKVYINTAKRIYDNPFVFMSNNKKHEIVQVIQNSIEDTIRMLLPFQNILQSYLGSTLNNEESESEEDMNSEASDTEYNNIPGDDEDLFDNDDSNEPPDLPDPPHNVQQSISNLQPETMSQTPPPAQHTGFFDHPQPSQPNQQNQANEFKSVNITQTMQQPVQPDEPEQGVQNTEQTDQFE